MAANITVPTHPWNSAYQPIYFGINNPANMYGWHYTGVTNNSGKAQFTMSAINIYDTPPCRLMYITSGVYSGLHVVTSIDNNGNILTDTNYISDASGSNARLLVNLVYRIWYGYPTQTKIIDVSPIWNATTGQLVTNIGRFLQSIFSIKPPVLGFDENMYSHFRVQIIAAKDLESHLLSFSANVQDVVDSFTGWDYDNDSDPSDAHKWYVINGTLAHQKLNNEYLSSGDVLAPDSPILFSNQCSIFTKIINDTSIVLNNRVYNVVVCLGTSAQTGIDFMEIEFDFIVS